MPAITSRSDLSLSSGPYQPPKVKVPPLKIQGIKTKIWPQLYALLAAHGLLQPECWVEPFLGSGVIAFNLRPHRAILGDTNPHLIAFYQAVQRGELTAESARTFLAQEGKLLQEHDAAHYLQVRARFNADHRPLDFLFLNRSCFNGLMRFNRQGSFNVPYCHKPERFSKAYISKICHQIEYVASVMTPQWDLSCQSFEHTIAAAPPEAIIYCDPPYIGRSTDYFGTWNEEDERKLHDCLMASGRRFIVSTWLQTARRVNPYVQSLWGHCSIQTMQHSYFVGAKESNRPAVTEALLYNF